MQKHYICGLLKKLINLSAPERGPGRELVVQDFDGIGLLEGLFRATNFLLNGVSW